MTMRRYAGWLAAAACAMALALPAAAAPLRDAAAAAGDCAACHKDAAALPARHKATKAMKLADCVGCHEKNTEDTLVGKMPGSHVHALGGVGCADCHGKGTAKPQAVEMARCLSCHGSGDKVAALTAKMKQNPHTSPHYGTELDCNVCHRQHEKSEDYCAECHRFGFKVP